MKIVESDILMSSSRTYGEKNEVRESLHLWVGEPPEVNTSQADHVTISPKAELLLKGSESKQGEIQTAENMKQEISLRKLIAEILSGKEVKLASIEKVKEQNPEIIEKAQQEAQQENQRQGWGLEYSYEQTHHEKETVNFEAQGIIKTADGQEVAFAIKLDMNREYLQKNSINIRAGDAAVVDPLIINFDGNAADLSSMKFDFDLNSDGKAEQISIPTAGRGLLAIDLNDDGIINNGSELFGPSTGNGFAELSVYDGDGNSWIDENDAVYQRLRVMTVDSQSSSTLSTLKDTGVGAVYLGRSATQFDVRTRTDNNLLGQVRTTGVYLREDGTPGTIQQLDLVT